MVEKRKHYWGLLLSIGGILGLLPSPSWAGNASSSLAVTAIVPPIIDVNTTPVNNITYDPTGTNAQSNITITATSGSTLVIRMGQGLNPDSGSDDSNPIRRMKSTQGNYLSYEITTDANHTDKWGNTTGTGVPVIGTGSQQTVPFFMRVLPNQNVPAGTYNDTLTMSTDY